MTDVVITDCDHPSVEIERGIFKQAGLSLSVRACRTAGDVISAGRGAVGLLSQYAPVTDAVLAALPSVRVIGRYGVGLDNIDTAAAARRGLSVVNVPDYCTDEVADYAFGLILALTRGLPRLDRAVHGGTWDFRVAGDVHRAASQQLGIIGLGRIGSAVAQRARASKFRIAASDPYPLLNEDVMFMTLPELLVSSDVVTVHAPLNTSTYHLLDASAFSLIKPGAFLVNTARGGLIDEEALTNALVSGRLRGAALDVLEEEPISPGDRLLQFPNVILTPHAAFYSEESIADMKTRVATSMINALNGEGSVPSHSRRPGVK